MLHSIIRRWAYVLMIFIKRIKNGESVNNDDTVCYLDCEYQNKILFNIILSFILNYWTTNVNGCCQFVWLDTLCDYDLHLCLLIQIGCYRKRSMYWNEYQWRILRIFLINVNWIGVLLFFKLFNMSYKGISTV